MVTERNKFHFVTIYIIGLGFLLTSVSTTLGHAMNDTQHETNEQQSPNHKQAAIATISVVSNNNDKDVETNVIINEAANSQVHTFSPRLDYSNEWRPVGRGDPLKNDPTFDYSPPTLEHVRYWAESTKENSKEESGSSSKQDINSKHFAHYNKPDILLLTKPHEHSRGSNSISHHPHPHSYPQPQPQPQPHPHPHPNQYAIPHQSTYAGKNAKGETPILQPKYTSVRRSYYAQNLPTRLMPPPMQSHSPPINTFNVPMKPSPAAQLSNEYRQSMSAAAMPTLGSQSSMLSHVKSQYHTEMSSTPSSMSAMSWMYNSPAAMQHYQHQQQQKQQQHYTMSSSSSPISKGTTQQETSRMPLPQSYDSHPQDSHHYVTYMRPSPYSMSSYSTLESYSPNSLRNNVISSNNKQSASGRKPWLQELLQKEVVKPSAKPIYTTSTTRFSYKTPTKSVYERMPSSKGSVNGNFTPYTPVTFEPAPPTIASISISATASSTSTTTTSRPQTAFGPMFSSASQPAGSTTIAPPTKSTTKHMIYTTPSTATTTPRATTTPSTTSSRLLIPATSNLAYRPTVAPMQMTTDSLFSHYKQPETPLRGPMYLIIEGHSKVKKYGKNGINLNLPKIVPVVPKREPIVRVAEPGEEKRGTPETFHVEHLHAKSITTTTTRPATTAKPHTTTTRKRITTAKPVNTSNPPLTTKLTAMTNITQTTVKPSVSTTTTTTTTSRPAATTLHQKANIANKTIKSTVEEIAKPLTTTTKPTLNEPLLKLELPNEPPTGMQGLFELFDSSLGGLFAEQPLDSVDMLPEPPKTKKVTTTAAATKATATHLTTPSTTVLEALNSAPFHSVTSAQTALVPVEASAHIGLNANQIVAAETEGSREFNYTTDEPPREVRQVFDYDQRPESRLKDFTKKRIDVVAPNEGGTSAFYEDEFDEYDYENNDDDDDGDNDEANQHSIKRLDVLTDGDAGGFVGDYENVELKEFGVSLGDVQMKAKMA